MKTATTIDEQIAMLKERGMIILDVCAHGHNLYDIRFPKSIKSGQIKGLDKDQRCNISGGLIIILHILKSISENRSYDFANNIQQLLSSPQFSSIKKIINHIIISPAKIFSAKER